LYLELRRHLGEVLRKLALQKESRVEEGHLMPNHVHMISPFHQSTPFRRWLGLSRARAQPIKLRVNLGDDV
jgi:REP element-mobilizing transposase RayT